MQVTGQTAAQGASVQCMQAMDTERSPALPSLMVTTRLRLMPHGTSFSFLHAVTQALHSMQRSASQRNFIRAMGGDPLERDDSCPNQYPALLLLFEHDLFRKPVSTLGPSPRASVFGIML